MILSCTMHVMHIWWNFSMTCFFFHVVGAPIYVRCRQVEEYNRNAGDSLLRWNKISLCLGLLAALGLSVVGNFQVKYYSTKVKSINSQYSKCICYKFVIFKFMVYFGLESRFWIWKSCWKQISLYLELLATLHLSMMGNFLVKYSRQVKSIL